MPPVTSLPGRRFGPAARGCLDYGKARGVAEEAGDFSSLAWHVDGLDNDLRNLEGERATHGRIAYCRLVVLPI